MQRPAPAASAEFRVELVRNRGGIRVDLDDGTQAGPAPVDGIDARQVLIGELPRAPAAGPHSFQQLCHRNLGKRVTAGGRQRGGNTAEQGHAEKVTSSHVRTEATGATHRPRDKTPFLVVLTLPSVTVAQPRRAVNLRVLRQHNDNKVTRTRHPADRDWQPSSRPGNIAERDPTMSNQSPSRHQLLTTAVAGATVAGTAGSAPSSETTHNGRHDAIVIGGGPAGVTAARCSWGRPRRGFIDGAIESGTRNAELLHRALGT